MNVTPLVDVVLVLLIIFMVVIPAMTQGLGLEVPAIQHVDERGQDDGPEPVTLSVNANGSLFLEEQPVRPEALEETLRAARRRHPRSRLILRGDRGVAYATIRELFERVQEVGFPGISLRVNQRGTES